MIQKDFFSRYCRTQTFGLLATWVLLQFFEWGKPGLVGSRANPQWVLLALLISATLTAFLTSANATAAAQPRRRIIAAVSGLVALSSVGAAVSSPVGWLVAITVWGAVLAAFGLQHYD